MAGPSVPGGSLEAAAAIASNDVWAVGNVNLVQPLIEHWDGRAWTVVQGAKIGPNVPKENERQLLAIAAVRPADIWVLGQYSPDVNGESTSRDVFEHWNGTTWTIVPSPQDVSTTGFSAMQDISAVASNDVWAVGGRIRGFGEAGRGDGALVEHWDGRAWTRVTAPTGDGPLSTVAAVSHSGVWAVRGGGFTTAQGSYGAFSPPQVLHWNGRAWRTVPAPRFEFLAMTARASKDVWAAGTRGKWNNVPFIAHWNGLRWSLLPDSLHETVPRTSYMSLSMRRAVDGTIVAFGSELDPNAMPQNRLWFRCAT